MAEPAPKRDRAAMMKELVEVATAMGYKGDEVRKFVDQELKAIADHERDEREARRTQLKEEIEQRRAQLKEENEQRLAILKAETEAEERKAAAEQQRLAAGSEAEKQRAASEQQRLAAESEAEKQRAASEQQRLAAESEAEKQKAASEQQRAAAEETRLARIKEVEEAKLARIREEEAIRRARADDEKEREKEVAKAADNFLEARRYTRSRDESKPSKANPNNRSHGTGHSGASTSRQSGQAEPKVCFTCKKPGHFSRDCRSRPSQPRTQTFARSNHANACLMDEDATTVQEVGDTPVTLSLAGCSTSDHPTNLFIRSGTLGGRAITVMRDTGCTGAVVRAAW